MKVTEQIDALIAMGRDPVAFLVVPRVVAGCWCSRRWSCWRT
jgi:ABC-type transporter Mla maintaining outer membrane lipid asymmetry permease subunit MlaE